MVNDIQNMNPPTGSFLEFAKVAQAIHETRGSNAKIKLCAGYFKSLNENIPLELAAQFLGEGAFSAHSGKRTSVGSRTYCTLAADFCEIDYEEVFKPCITVVGSSPETIEKLFTNIPAAQSKWKGEFLSLKQVKSIYDNLSEVSSRNDKQRILSKAWSKMTPLEIKYFLRIMGRGSLRIGFESKSIVSAIAKAFGFNMDEVRYVHMLTSRIGETAVLAKNDRLDEVRFTLFHPVAFMLASPIESREVDDYSKYIAEEKFDGIRCQLHVSGEEVKIFSRDLNEITHSFPEIANTFTSKKIPGAVFDGEICVVKDDTILPFQLLQKRMELKKPSTKIIEQYPTLLISYDVLFYDGVPAFEQPLHKRRELLSRLSKKYDLPISTQTEISDKSQIDELFEWALKHGNEGLMLKLKDSSYEYGQRKKSWLKVKKPSGSLHTVMMYAHAGSGKRGGTYSDFTLGISVRNDDRYEEEFIPIGKAYGGYTAEDLKKLNARIKEITVEKYGPTLGLRPDIVVELEFDGIRENKRTKANYTLRFPRFKAIRWDLSPNDADTLKEVERLYQKKIQEKRLRQAENPSFKKVGG